MGFEDQFILKIPSKEELSKMPPPPSGEIQPVPSVLSSKEDDCIRARKEWEQKEKEKDRIRILEKEIANMSSKFQKLDDKLFLEEGEKKKYIEELKNLSSEAKVYLYHGLNSGSYDSALEILNSLSQGVEQRSGPALSLLPAGQFWKGVGFRYALRRDQIAFPGESNPKAIIKISGENGLEDVGYIKNESKSLPLDQFEAEVLRSKFADPDPENEKKLMEKLDYFSKMREKNKPQE